MEEFFDLEKSSASAVEALKGFIENGSSAIQDGVAEILTSESGATSISYRFNSSYKSVAAGIIKSRSVGKNWLRSTTTLHTKSVGSNDNGLIWRYAVDAWLEGTEVENNEQYLDEGGDENTI